MKKFSLADQSNSLEMYRKILLNKKAEFLVALGINCKKLAESREESGADPAKATHDEFVRLRLNRVFYGQLRQVEYALDRLELGDYGTCVACGSPISPSRLQAVPWAMYCVACQDRTNPYRSRREVRKFVYPPSANREE